MSSCPSPVRAPDRPRIRDKVAASRKKGMWMGGFVPLGYRAESRKLVIRGGSGDYPYDLRAIPESWFSDHIGAALIAEGVKTRSGRPIDKGFLYKLLNNRVYIGDAVHKGTAYPGEHEAIIIRELRDKVHAILQDSPRLRAARTRAQTPALLKGLIFGPDGKAMSPTHTRKGQKLYRYYISQSVLKKGAGACPVGRISAAEIEAAVIDQLRGLLRSPEIIVGTWLSQIGNL